MYTYITHAWVWSFRSGVGIVKTTLYYGDGDDDDDDDGDDGDDDDDDDDDGDGDDDDDDDCGDGDGDRDRDGDGDGGDDVIFRWKQCIHKCICCYGNHHFYQVHHP